MAESYAMLEPRKIALAQQKNPFAKISDIIYDILAEAILSSAIPPGSKLNVAKISEQMGVSNTPVIRAVERLRENGLVTEVRSGGKYRNYFVFDISSESLADLFAARRAIESEAAYLCALKRPLIDFGKLLRLAEDFQCAWQDFVRAPDSAPSISERARIDWEFHHQLILATENQYLVNMFDSLQGTLNYLSIRTCEFVATEPSRDNLVLLGSQHVSICRAIDSGIPELSRNAMTRHIDFCSNRCLINRAASSAELSASL